MNDEPTTAGVAVRELATAVADAINGDGSGTGLVGWTGTDGGSPVSIEVAAVLRVDRAVGYEAEELRLVRVRQDFIVWWRPQ